MKTTWVAALMLVSIVAATIFHVFKDNTNFVEDGMDQLAAGLKGANAIVPETTNISLKLVDVDVYLWCRYLLAPRSINQKEKPDTVLAICKAGAPDSVVQLITSGRVKIWANKDKSYQYFLTSSH